MGDVSRISLPNLAVLDQGTAPVTSRQPPSRDRAATAPGPANGRSRGRSAARVASLREQAPAFPGTGGVTSWAGRARDSPRPRAVEDGTGLLGSGRRMVGDNSGYAATRPQAVMRVRSSCSAKCSKSLKVERRQGQAARHTTRRDP